jgi:glucose/arabinose dehydrogenase
MNIVKQLVASALFVTTPLLFISQAGAQEQVTMQGTDNTTVYADVLERFSTPWAMALLPDGHGLVTEKTGDLWVTDNATSGV